jgi:hypothetical protein
MDRDDRDGPIDHERFSRFRQSGYIYEQDQSRRVGRPSSPSQDGFRAERPGPAGTTEGSDQMAEGGPDRMALAEGRDGVVVAESGVKG